jgi:hypothetical protein
LTGTLWAGPAQVQAESWFEDVTVAAGVARKHTNRSFTNPYARIMEGYTALGAAVAVDDFDGDGFEDLFVTDSSETGRNFLYRNRGDFTFEEMAEQAGLPSGNDAANASADALWFDYNGDGRPDLFVVRFGQNQLFENVDGKRFREVTKQAGLERYLNSITAIAFDYDGDRDLDLFVGGYFQPVSLFDPQTPRFFPESFETANNGGGLVLFRNDGNGTFTDVTAAAGLTQSGWSLDLGHGDVDQDGDDDLYVAADFGTDRFYLNNGNGTFKDVTEQAIGIDTKKGMNVDWGDFDNDGFLDIYVTNITDEYMKEGNFLWRNNGDGTFSDVARETGTHNTGWGWAGKFFDYDNDGWLDLYVVNGWVSAGPDNYVLDIFELIVQPDVDLADARVWPPMGDKTLSGYQHNSLFHNEGGTLFKNEAARHGLDLLQDGRGVAVADFDHDGRLDLFISNANEKPVLARNESPQTNHWLQLELRGTASNPSAVGARVWVTAGGKRRLSFVNGGNGFASQSSRRLHFGLGAAQTADQIEVLWPSGGRQTFTAVAADGRYLLIEGAKTLEPLPVARQAEKAPAAGEGKSPKPVETPSPQPPAVAPSSAASAPALPEAVPKNEETPP